MSRRARAIHRSGALIASLLLLGIPRVARAQEQQPEPMSATSTVFARYSDRILKIQLIETSSSAKSTIGTGFFVSADGLMLTNYHVVADRIHEPEDYRVEIVGDDGTALAVEILAVDVIHDLAVLRTGLTTPRFFALGPVSLRQGDRLYSLGHPSDLGLSIVEGTYNGLLKHTLYPKIHFTGSINPGMSGGPAITGEGRVAGVNVSTMGQQRSFLVPESAATALLRRVQAAGFAPSPEPLKEVAAQLHAYQQEYLGQLFEGETKMVDFGPFRVVSEPAPVFRCWGGSSRSDDRDDKPMFEELWHRCGTDDDVFIAGDQSSGVVSVEHRSLSSTKLNGARFASLYSRRFGEDNTPSGDEKHVTVWKCSTRNVTTVSTPLRSVLCLRALKKLDGLYDAVLKVAVLGSKDNGLISTLTLSGASFENIERLTNRYLERIGWR